MSQSSAPRSNPWKWIVSAGIGLSVLGVFACLIFLFTACSFNKYLLAAGLPAPDRAYQTGTIYGYDVYIWDCYQGKRIVLWRTSAEMSQSAYTREEAACGGVTPIETRLSAETRRARDPRGFW